LLFLRARSARITRQARWGWPDGYDWTSQNLTTTFGYGPDQQRWQKHTEEGQTTKDVYYARDAQGNVMAVYEFDGTDLIWAEQHLYGSTRLGILNLDEPLWPIDPDGDDNASTSTLGLKYYELTNHLGNVMAVLSDNVYQYYSGGNLIKLSDIINLRDYFPFGYEMHESAFNFGKYRYGFNGKEADYDDEFSALTHYDYGFRVYNPAIGRFLSVDPLTRDYASWTPYAFAMNRVIDGVDLDGLEHFMTTNGELIGKLGFSTEVMIVDEKDVAFAKSTLTHINNLEKDIHYFRKNPPLPHIDPVEQHDRLKESLLDVSTPLGMTHEELNTRAFMSTLKETENHGNGPLPYNAKHGFLNGKLNTFTDKSYEEAPEDYAMHPYEGEAGSTAAGAYQLLRPTFKSQLRTNPKVIDFGPNSQDYAVIGIFSTPGIDALDPIKAGDLQTAVQRLIKDKWGNTQFASLPGGGQEMKGFTMMDLKKMFQENIKKEISGQSNISVPKGELLKN
jgi:RHS repeat-associated protein